MTATSAVLRQIPTPEPTHRDHVRSPVDVLRLIVGLIAVVVGIGFTNLADSALLGLSDDGVTAMDGFPTWANDLPGTILAALIVVLAATTAGWALFTRRFRRLFLLTGAFVIAALLSVAVGDLILRLVDSEVRGAFMVDGPIFRYRAGDGTLHPGDPLLAGAVAMLGVGASYLRNAAVRRLGILLLAYALVSALTSHVPALGLLSDIGIGIAVSAAVLLIAGRHDLAPDEIELRVALASIGIDIVTLRHLDVDARGSAPWVGTTTTGEQVFVKALGRDERSADLMFRAYRWLRFRKTGDHRPFVSLRRAVEHEALVSLQAAALGVRTPKILGVANAGIDGMALVYEAVEGSSADEFDDIDDAGLEAIWTMVSQLHAKRIAHRDLRLANIFIDAENKPLLIDFGFSELAADDQLVGTDVAELLASTSAVVGTERAVAAAHRATGLGELDRAMPWLQPSALSSATRRAINGDKGLQPIRQMLVDQCGVPEEPLVKLVRIEGKTVFMIATLALSAWFLLPQLANIDDLLSQVADASIQWVLAAVVFSLFTYVAATASLLGTIPLRLRFGPALAAQLASSFANRVTPAKVGGVAINLRFFQRQGVATAVAVTAVGLNAVAGLMVHIGLTFMFLFLSSNDSSSADLPIPSPAVVGIALAFALAVTLFSAALPVSRRLLITYVVPQLRAGWQSIGTISHSPARLLMLFGGSAAITLFYLAAMAASLQAFGSDTPLPVVGLLFLTGSVIANAAPTPGGLGAAEAALIAAFSTVEEAVIVIPAVFLYRLVTFWLPILPGWASLAWLRSTDNI